MDPYYNNNNSDKHHQEMQNIPLPIYENNTSHNNMQYPQQNYNQQGGIYNNNQIPYQNNQPIPYSNNPNYPQHNIQPQVVIYNNPGNMNLNPVPNAMYFMGQPVHFINDPMERLRTATGAYIKQKLELFEVLTGCETKNRYMVYLKDGNNYYYVFKCKEESEWCMRNCCR